MPNLFSSINLNTPKSVASTFDFKVLDATCNHQVLNESVDLGANASDMFSNVVYSGNGVYSNGSIFSGGIDPEASVFVTTKLPISDIGVHFFEVPNSSSNNKITEEFVVPTGLTQQFRFIFPPVPNSTVAKLKITDVDEFGNPQTVYFDFVNYTLSQLFGIVQFNNTSDIGSTVDFTYVGDKIEIFAKAKDGAPNWEFVGYNQKNQGVFRIYGRAFKSNQSSLNIRYKSVAKECPRCGGNSVVNDLHFNDNKNNYYLVYDFSKLIQDFFKRLLTRVGSNGFHVDEGSQIPIYVGSKSDPQLIDTLIRTEVVKIVNVVRTKQNTQLIVQGISLAEQLGVINKLLVTAIDPTSVDVEIEVQSLSQGTAQIKTNIRGN